jgi:Fic family protein
MNLPGPEPIGLAALMRELGLRVPPPAVQSEVVSGARRTLRRGNHVVEQYPRGYAPENSVAAQLKFALRYEPVDLSVLHGVFRELGPNILEAWIRDERTGIFARRAWYLYELLTGRTLDIPDSGPLGYADLLDPELHITGIVRRARRQRINDNLLGGPQYCPLIRRTEALNIAIHARLDREARSLVESCDPGTLARAVQFLYTQETKSSFAIEGEAPNPNRTERFVSALSHAAEFDHSNTNEFVKLQNMIVDSRYAASGWRSVQNYVGRTRSDFQEHVHFVCPRPENVGGLMTGWMRLVSRLYESEVDPVCAAAATAFGFVFIHPFEDGNGRIHRFLIHHVLARAGFTPAGLLFPVSAVMLRDRRAYDQVLASYSDSILPLIEYTLDAQGGMTVQNQTDHLYKFWDATNFSEYLYRCVDETIKRDLQEEIGFLQVFDTAVRETMDIVDMPDRRASLLVRFIVQNKGTLSKGKRSQFPELLDEELTAIETAVRATMEHARERKGSESARDEF